ncbi:MAG: glycogen synthase [Gammaproteobacteria bacterium]
MKSALHVLMVASENDGIKTAAGQDAKAGGIGDVVRDIAPALASLHNCRITVVIPSYGFLDKLEGARLLDIYHFSFAGSREGIMLLQVPGKTPNPKVRHLVLHHARFASRDRETNQLEIYCDDPPERPFATDATKYACFCAAVAQGLKRKLFGEVNRVHLHDWHAAFLLILRSFDQSFGALRELRTVYTIHNLALQGIRPLRGDPSSLEMWYPHIALKTTDKLLDPEYRDCLNPMAIGVRLSDAVHVVSPGYKSAILAPSIPRRNDPDAYYYGGEGLEGDLQTADREDRLFGILNGCDYDERKLPPRDLPAYRQLLQLLEDTVSRGASKAAVHHLALKRIQLLRAGARRPKVLLTCVTRIVNQKLRLMHADAGHGKPSLEQILEGLSADGVLILLGTGDRDLARFLFDVSNRFHNFVFVNVFNNDCAGGLYANGDLFLMPSSFEPCGISQMLAMRDGQPCVVHHTGGLKDTVQDGRTGFAFGGERLEAQAKNFVHTVFRAINILSEDTAGFQAIRETAFQQRFLWGDTVRQYVHYLYRSE